MKTICAFVQQRHGTGTLTFQGVRANLWHGEKLVAKSSTDSFGAIKSGVYQQHVFGSDGHWTVTTRVVGNLFWCLGQSNEKHWFTTPGTQKADTAAFNIDASGHLGTLTGAGAVAFANSVHDATHIPVVMLDCAVSGSSILQENNTGHGSWDDGTDLAHARQALRAVGGKCEASIIALGETDARHDMTNLQAGLEDLLNAVTAYTGQRQVFYQLIGNSQFLGDQPLFDQMRAIQEAAIANTAHTSIGANPDGLAVEGVHLTADSLFTVGGSMMGATVISWLDAHATDYL